MVVLLAHLRAERKVEMKVVMSVVELAPMTVETSVEMMAETLAVETVGQMVEQWVALTADQLAVQWVVHLVETWVAGLVGPRAVQWVEKKAEWDYWSAVMTAEMMVVSKVARLADRLAVGKVVLRVGSKAVSKAGTKAVQTAPHWVELLGFERAGWMGRCSADCWVASWVSHSAEPLDTQSAVWLELHLVDSRVALKAGLLGKR